ncbi:MAG: ABC transporter ATP-binding protein [Acidobacteriota bacterium]
MVKLKYLLPYLAQHPRRLAAGLACVFGMSSLGLLGPFVIGEAVDVLREGVSVNNLLFYSGLVVLLAGLQGGFSYGQRMILVTLSRRVEFSLREDYLDRLLRLPPAFFQRSYTGDLMARATNDLEAVRMVCGPAIMYSANTVFTGIGGLALMASIEPRLTLVAVCTVPAVALATRELGQRVHHHFEQVQEQFSTVSTRAQENLSGVRVVRAYAQENGEILAFRGANRELVERNRRLILWQSAFHPGLQLLVGFGYVGVLAYGGALTYLGAITVGDLVKFNLLLARLTWPMIAVGWVVNLLQRGAASMGRIEEVLEAPVTIASRGAENAPPRPGLEGAPSLFSSQSSSEVFEGRLNLQGLTFSYDVEGAVYDKVAVDDQQRSVAAAARAEAGEGRSVLMDIDLDVPAGTTVALIGRTGSGKSSLLSLIPRLSDPPPGSVLLDGVDVRELPLASLRSAIGFVPQETFLFSATVEENIAFGRPDASRKEIEEVARLSGLGLDLELLPKGLDTVVGERGVTLSGGQKQRVALARALLRRPAVLILDDSLSAVDTHTEEEILGNLKRFFAGRTVLMVSHRISTARQADEVIVLEDGRITQRGTHEDLVKKPGLYAELHRRQQLEEQLAAV